MPRFEEMRRHLTRGYSIDLFDCMRNSDLRDPWRASKRKTVDYLLPGYKSDLGRDDPDNRSWAVRMCMAHEKRLQTVTPWRGPGRSAPLVTCAF